MAIGICSGCGLHRHLCLVLQTDGIVSDYLPERQYCETCGSYVVGIITALERYVGWPIIREPGR